MYSIALYYLYHIILYCIILYIMYSIALYYLYHIILYCIILLVLIVGLAISTDKENTM